MRRLALVALAVIFLSGTAFAQNKPVYQTGTVTPGHAARIVAPGVIGDGGAAAGSATLNSGYLTELGITNTGTPLCINDALITAPGGYHQLCLGANALGGGLISYNAYGGAAATGLSITLNGSAYAFPPTGSGNILGPNSSGLGHIPVWNNTIGTLLGETAAIVTDQSLTLNATQLNPGGASPAVNVPANLNTTVFVQGNNTDVHGGMGIYSLARDAAGTNSGNKGVGYGIDANVYPLVDHGLASPQADMNAVVASNIGIERATSGLFVGGTAHATAASGYDFVADLELSAWASFGIIFDGHYIYGIDFSQGVVNGSAAYAGAPIRMQNNGFIVARNVANSADVTMIGVGADNDIYVGDLKIKSDAHTPGVTIAGSGDSGGVGVNVSGTYTSYGIDLRFATLGTGAIRIPNNSYLFGENAAGTLPLAVAGYDGTNDLVLGDLNAAASYLFVAQTTGGGDQPLCINPTTHKVTMGTGNAC